MVAGLSRSDSRLRYHVYRHFELTGRAPTIEDLLRFGDSDDPDAESSLRVRLLRLHEAHAVVLENDGTIRMALPFSARDVGYAVRRGDGTWWANCAWDALALPRLIGVDAVIEASWLDDRSPVDLAVKDGTLTSFDGFVHFALPAHRWWDDIVET